MKLVNKTTLAPVTIGTNIFDSDGHEAIIDSMPPPHTPSSEGKVAVTWVETKDSCVYYPTVFNLEWIEREDRDEPRHADSTTINQIAIMQSALEEKDRRITQLVDDNQQLLTRLAERVVDYTTHAARELDKLRATERKLASADREIERLNLLIKMMQ